MRHSVSLLIGLLSGPFTVASAFAVSAPSTFGTSQETIVQVPAAAFVPRSSGVQFVLSGSDSESVPGYIGYNGGDFPGGTPFWAPVSLPAGALITGVDFYTRTPYSAPAGDMKAYLREYTDIASYNDIVIVDSAACTFLGGCLARATEFTNHTVSGSSQYVILIHLGQALLTDAAGYDFKAVAVHYKLQVSPAPAVATFSDVPTTSPQFRFVEALVAAGITAGCGGGNFCPNQPVTRGQMAVFLATALGLQWN